MTENGKTVTVLYLCKRDSHCKGKCYEQCHLTSMKEHAKNTFDKEPWNTLKGMRLLIRSTIPKRRMKNENHRNCY